jgi:thiamine pyrophosphokinase
MADQDTTDFQKCLFWIRAYESEHKHEKPMTVLVLGGLGGRLDQTLSNLHTMYCMEPGRKAYLASNDSVAILLSPTWSISPESPKEVNEPHKIYCSDKIEGPCSGLLPLGTHQALVKTKGLQWNIDHQLPLAFGKIVSTSNHFDEKDESCIEMVEEEKHHVVTVETNEPIIWTVEAKFK